MHKQLEHGGNLNEAVVRFSIPRNAWLDLSTGINPQSYPITALPADIWHRLPEHDPAMERAAQAYYDAPHLLAVAGSQAVIQVLPRLRLPARVVIAAPVYAEHAYRWRQAGHAVTEIAYADLESAVDTCDVMVVCNPNNPTGERISPSTLIQWSERLAARQGWLVVDEAFADTTSAESVASFAQRPGLIVLRSMGKFFGLAGIRLGFVIAANSLLEQIAEVIGPWGVSTAAQKIGCEALMDREWQNQMRQTLHEKGQRLHQMLREYGIYASGTPLYQWWPEQQSELFATHMAHQAIWVRRFSSGAHGIRLGLPYHEHDWQKLQQALASWRQIRNNTEQNTGKIE